MKWTLFLLFGVALAEGTTIATITNHLKRSEYGPAEVNFHAMNNDANIAAIADGMYGYHEQLAGFVLFLPKASQRLVVFRSWYSLLSRNSAHATNSALILNKMLSEEIRILCGSTAMSSCSAAPTELKNLKTNSDSYRSLILNNWASQVRSRSFTTVINFGSPSALSITGRILEDALPSLVDSVASNGAFNNVNITVDFVKGLRWNSHKYIALNSLYSRVSTSQSKLLVGLAIKDAMSNLRGPDPVSGPQQNFNSLKSRLQYNLQCVVWHSAIWFRNTHYRSSYNEYLYGASSAYQIDNENRGVYTWGQNARVTEARFVLERATHRSDVSFFVRNIYWNQYLWSHSSGKTYQNKDRMHVSLQSGSTSCVPFFGLWFCPESWRIDLEGTQNIKFYNNNRAAYMYASQFFKTTDRRYPFLWMPGSATVESSWKVEC